MKEKEIYVDVNCMKDYNYCPICGGYCCNCYLNKKKKEIFVNVVVVWY